MRSVLGPVALNALFLLTGSCILYAAGLVSDLRDLAAASGLAFLAGLALITLLTIALLTAGVGLHPLTVLVVSALTCLAVLAGGPRTRLASLAVRAPTVDLPAAARWCRAHPWMVLGGVAALTYFGLGCFRASVSPTEDYDSWAIWMRKALLLTDFGHLPVPFFTDRAYLPTHQDYPLLLPVLEAMWFRFAGHVDTVSVNLEPWLMLAAFAGAAAYLLSRRSLLRAPHLVVIAALLVAPGVTSQVFNGYADISLSLFAGLGVLAAGLWVADGDWRLLALSAIMLGAAANTKSEGLPIAAIALLAALLLRWPAPRARRTWLPAAAGTIAAVLPWHLWVAVHGVPADPDLPLHRLVDLGYLADRASRLGVTLTSLVGQLSSIDQWLLLVPLGVGLATVCLLRRQATRVAAFYLMVGGGALLAYLLVYWASGLDIHWYLLTSATRVVDAIVFIAALGAAHLATGTLPRRTADELP